MIACTTASYTIGLSMIASTNAAFAFAYSTTSPPPPLVTQTEIQLTTWKFTRGDDPRFSTPAFDDSNWRQVDVPHECREHLDVDRLVVRVPLV